MFSLLVAVGSPAASLSGSAADARTGGGCSPGILMVSHSAVPTKQAGGKRNTVPVAWLQIHYVINSVCITYTHTHMHTRTQTHTHTHTGTKGSSCPEDVRSATPQHAAGMGAIPSHCCRNEPWGTVHHEPFTTNGTAANYGKSTGSVHEWMVDR